MMRICFVTMTIAFVIALVIAEYFRGHPRVRLLIGGFKIAASVGFLAVALTGDPFADSFGQWIFIALVCCFLGDVFLIPRTSKTFLIGMLAFLAGHLAFTVAFSHRSVALLWAGVGAGVMVVVATSVGRWLWADVSRRMKLPLLGYFVAISVMVSLALGVWVPSHNHVLIAAAVLFAVSDILIARDRFKRSAFINRAIALPIYYASQLLFAVCF